MSPSFAGIDRLQYPGDAFMSGLMQNTNLLWTGFYLAPAPSQGNTSWMQTLGALRSMGPGWGVAPIFVGQQHASGPGSHVLTADQGRHDGARAAELMAGAGFDDLSVIYLDIEIGGNLPQDLLTYVNSWFAFVRSNETAYRPGVYCSFKDTPSQLRATNPDLFFWVFNINKFLHSHHLAFESPDVFRKPDIASDSGCAFASAWQWIQGFASITTTLQSGTPQTLPTWDLDVSLLPDPSMPERTFDADTGTWG